MIEHIHKIHVYYRDVDQMGIVYYTRYIEYFEEARTELLRSIGINVTDFENQGYYLPVISVECKYKYPARFDEELKVITRITENPRSTIKIEYKILNDNNGLCVSGATIHTFINKIGKTVKPPKELMEKIKRNM